MIVNLVNMYRGWLKNYWNRLEVVAVHYIEISVEEIESKSFLVIRRDSYCRALLFLFITANMNANIKVVLPLFW